MTIFVHKLLKIYVQVFSEFHIDKIVITINNGVPTNRLCDLYFVSYGVHYLQDLSRPL